MTETAEGRRPRPGQVVEGRIEDLAYGGAGVMRISGWVVMVPGAFPSDVVRVRIRRRRKGVFQGDLLELLEAAPDRVAPQCPHLPVCGGCALQGLDPAAQTRYKASQAVELLRRIGKVRPAQIAEPWKSPSAYFYRNKMEFTFGRRPWITKEALEAGEPFEPGPALGLHPRGVYQGVFNVDACQLQSSLSNRIVVKARQIALKRKLSVYNSRTDEGLLRHLVIRQAATSDDLLVVLVVRQEDAHLADMARELARAVPEITAVVASVNLRRATVAQGDYEIPLLGEPYLHEEILGLTYRIGASSFFQTQTRGGAALVKDVLAAGGFAPDDCVLDLYCGIGAFSLPLARQVKHVLGVEIMEAAVEEARLNATRNGIENAEFLAAAVETRKSQPWEAPPGNGSGGDKGTWDVVVVDPPRSGLHPKALVKLRAMRPRRIVYVSCNPATLARDAAALVEEDDYRAGRLKVFDLFPQTPHLESVLVLERV